MDLAIFGAQAIALGAYEAIHNLYPVRYIRCFLVTERGGNAEYLSGIPVLELEPFSKSLTEEEKTDIEILIATPENIMPIIEKSLDACGLFCHVRLTSVRWAELMSFHYACDKERLPLKALPVGYHKANIHMFMAKFYKDRPLSGRYSMPEWVTLIQVGAVLCEKRVANILDCDGENISDKNRNYSELTALYWMWKNRLVKTSADSEYEYYEYYGLMHYRRILDLSEDDVLRLADNEVDVVLPYPMPYEPDIEAHHEKYLSQADWQAVKKAVTEYSLEYWEPFSHILRQKFFYNYNIILARKAVLEKYCSWLFPILERIEELSIPKGSQRADRYMGYVGETLETLYFTAHKDKYNITHTGCRFLI